MAASTSLLPRTRAPAPAKPFAAVAKLGVQTHLRGCGAITRAVRKTGVVIVGEVGTAR